MGHIRQGDADLHFSDGEHRTTAPLTVPGTRLAAWERRIRAHLEEHAAREKHPERLDVDDATVE